MSKLVLLDAGVQNYAWGKDAANSFVAKMKGLSQDTSGKKYAELWVGTHESCPSRLATGANKGQLLDDFFKDAANRRAFFSPAHQASEFRDMVPYLLKILSIGSALSIQAHPCKKLAEKLHAAKPDKYKDPNHKPELICALTPFEALCCFRPLKDIIAFLHAAPELADLVAAAEVLGELFTTTPPPALPAADSAAERGAIKGLMQRLYAADAARCAAALRAHLRRVRTEQRCVEDTVFVRLYGEYPDDVGCWMVYVLNYIQLVPGQALFLSDSEPHAYLSGDGVEIMACSDNVVRAGLTPKWKDVPTLIDMLKYDTTGLADAKHERATSETATGWQVQLYRPPAQFPDFSLYRVEFAHDQGSGVATVTLPTVGLGFCLDGGAKVNGVEVKAGDCFAVPYGTVTCQALNRRTLLFISSSNDLEHRSKM